MSITTTVASSLAIEEQDCTLKTHGVLGWERRRAISAPAAASSEPVVTTKIGCSTRCSNVASHRVSQMLRLGLPAFCQQSEDLMQGSFVQPDVDILTSALCNRSISQHFSSR